MVYVDPAKNQRNKENRRRKVSTQDTPWEEHLVMTKGVINAEINKRSRGGVQQFSTRFSLKRGEHHSAHFASHHLEDLRLLILDVMAEIQVAKEELS